MSFCLLCVFFVSCLATAQKDYKTHTVQNKETLSQKIYNFPIQMDGIAHIEEAISTVGGIDLKEINSNLELIKKPNSYCIGEMLDWDAPTGGYLLQACFSMGYHLAEHLNKE